MSTVRRPGAFCVAAALTASSVLLGCGGASGRQEPRSAASGPVSGYGWGSDSFDQLGIVSNSALATPTAIALPQGTTAVALGRDFTLALAGGAVYSWGHDDLGQLGDGLRENRSKPRKLQLTGVVAVAAGSQYGLAITGNGDLYSWGANADGQLGDGSHQARSKPARVSLPAPVSRVAAGSSHVVAVTSDGAAWAWGSNSSGQLGTGSTTSASKPQHVRLPHGMRLAAVAVGERHSLAVTTTHRLLGWGSNAQGRLGLGARQSVLTPTTIPSAGNDVRAVAAGSVSSYLLSSAGSVVSAGRNDAGQLGDGTTTDRAMFATTKLPSGFLAGSIAAGPSQGFAVSRNGAQIVAWGRSDGGLLGDGRDRNALTPTPVQLSSTLGGPAPDRHFLAVAAGYYTMVALAEQGPVADLRAVGPVSPVPAGAPLTLAVQGYDAAGNDLGQPSDATASMSDGSCDGSVCTPRSPGFDRVVVAVSAARATALVRVAPAERRASAVSSGADAGNDSGGPSSLLIGLIAGACGIVGLATIAVVFRRRSGHVREER